MASQVFFQGAGWGLLRGLRLLAQVVSTAPAVGDSEPVDCAVDMAPTTQGALRDNQVAPFSGGIGYWVVRHFDFLLWADCADCAKVASGAVTQNTQAAGADCAAVVFPLGAAQSEPAFFELWWIMSLSCFRQTARQRFGAVSRVAGSRAGHP